MVSRWGHSLPELIVAVTFLGVTMTAVSGAIFASARWTESAVLRQEALRLAAETLDSLRAAPAAVDGGDTVPGFRIRWRTDADGAVAVEVSGSVSPTPLAALEGRRLPDLPSLPDLP